MKLKIAAIAVAFALTFSAARADDSYNVGNYASPPMISFLVSGGESIDSSLDNQQLAAYCMTFGMMLNQQWPGALPNKFSNTAPDVLKALIFSGSNIGAAANDGAQDAQSFTEQNDRDSDAARNTIAVLTKLVDE